MLSTRDYLTAILFTDLPEGWVEDIDPASDNPFSFFYPEDVAQASKDLETFQELMGDDLLEELIEESSPEQVAYDLWFTRNHHGCGFWESKSVAAIKATEIAYSMGEVDIELKIASEPPEL